MTNSEAIKWLNEAEILDLTRGNTKDRQAINAAISALKAQLSNTLEITNSSDDLIRRHAAINLEYIVKDINGVDYVMLSEVQMKLRKMPSAEPEIIHCKDCIHWINKHLCEIWSRYGTIETKPDFYCGFGVRRNNVIAWMPLPEPYSEDEE